MGLFQHAIQVLDQSGATVAVVNAWVDTASSYSWLPRNIARILNIRTATQRTFVLANGRRERCGVAQVRISLGDEPYYTYCAFANEGEEFLLGAIALEEAGLTVDVVNKRLVPADSYALTAL
jgi:predicted aspartyl protease